MIVSGVKHACATCIRGHRSSACTHADRQLYEIRKKGRPVSQCPHCRDLRKIKSCHTRCECGETPGEQGRNSACRCHTGAPCTCAAPAAASPYAPLPPELSNTSSVSNSLSDGATTPVDSIGSMLHTFQSNPQTQFYTTPAQSFTQIKNQRSSPYEGAYASREASSEVYPGGLIQQDYNDATPYLGESQPLPVAMSFPLTDKYTLPNGNHATNAAPWLENASELSQPSLPQRAGSSSISKTMRSIGTNTEPLPLGIWPDNLFTMPDFAQLSTQPPLSQPPIQHLMQNQQQGAKSTGCCPKAKDMPLQDLGLVGQLGGANGLTAPVPGLFPFYEPQVAVASSMGNVKQEPGLVQGDPYEDEFDPEYFESLFDVPGCSLPGVQCRCGDDCSCAGCRTHRDNEDKVAFGDFSRMDFTDTVKVREHPAGCCDTRSAHVHSSAPASG